MDIYIAGAGGFGRETLDALLACGASPAAFLDDHVTDFRRGLPVLRPGDAPPGAAFVVGIADPHARRAMVSRLVGQGLQPRTVVHPRAIVGPDTSIGEGSVVLGGAHVSSSIRLGAHVQVNYNATIGHDCVVEDYATVYPGANVSGNVNLGRDVTVGSGAVVLQGRTIGAGAFVGAGAVVTRDVAPGHVVAGVPARVLRER